MLEVTHQKAKDLFLKDFPGRKIRWITHHGSDWYVCATDNDPDEGLMNPYFKVDDATGKISEFYVIQNLDLFDTITKQIATKQIATKQTVR